VERLRTIEPGEDLDYVLEAIRMLKRELAGRVPLIGFAGAPFTLASYIVEGGSSRSFEKTKSLMYSEPEVWRALATKLAGVVRDYLAAQIDAGVQAVQLFDSWVGALSPEDYREFALPYSRSVLQGLADSGVPVIHFATGTAGILELLRQAGGDVVGLDWRIDLDKAWDILGRDVAVQGNLDPHILFAPLELLLRRADDILRRAATHRGHIFNLGHGILPETPVENVQALIEHVHRVTGR
jgi:uroporphyrinogen decarboxylase